MTTFSSPINLPNIKVTDQETLDNGDIIVRVECLENGTHCKCCGKHIIKRHSLNKIIRLNNTFAKEYAGSENRFHSQQISVLD
jgi:hypothetical protein